MVDLNKLPTPVLEHRLDKASQRYDNAIRELSQLMGGPAATYRQVSRIAESLVGDGGVYGERGGSPTLSHQIVSIAEQAPQGAQCGRPVASPTTQRGIGRQQ